MRDPSEYELYPKRDRRTPEHVAAGKGQRSRYALGFE